MFCYNKSDATSIKGIRAIVQALGAIPLASSLKEAKHMLSCIETRTNQKSAVMIFPEAHIWPYYTGIRNYPYQSFRYASRLQKPIFVLTNCYQKSKIFKRPKIVTFVDGPFYPNPNLSEAAAAKELRDIAYKTMCERAKEHSIYEYIKYVKEE